MNNRLKYLALVFVAFIVIGVLFLFSDKQGKLQIYFCDVGQGDGIYIRLPDGSDMLVDGGPNKKILDCLGENMPFYDRKIDLVLLTHPQADHLNGLVDVIQRYNVGYFVATPVANQTQGYQKILELIKNKNIQTKNLYKGEKIEFAEASFETIWPEKQWLISKINCLEKCPIIASNQGSVLGIQTNTNLNNFSIMGVVKYGDFDLLLTGDGDEKIQDQMIKANITFPITGELEVLKVPHHGSKTGMSNKFLEVFKPSLAVISVGKNNRYNHPSSEIIDRLKANGAKILRTDEKGTVKIETDGKNWRLIN